MRIVLIVLVVVLTIGGNMAATASPDSSNASVRVATGK